MIQHIIYNNLELETDPIFSIVITNKVKNISIKIISITTSYLLL